ncbi:MAG: GNAT family N-acetyltransferase, partial [bacterium]
MVDDVVGKPWKFTYTLELPKSEKELRFGDSRNHGRIRWAVNKATRLGVQVRPAETQDDLRAWYELYVDTMRWHASLPRPYRFLKALWELLRPRGLMQLLLAEQQEGGSRSLLAGSVFLMFGQTVYYYLNGRRRGALALRPNDAILWRAIHDACRMGFRRYDLGEVDEDQQGLTEFKLKWGAKAIQSYRYYYPPLREVEPHSLQSSGHIYR